MCASPAVFLFIRSCMKRLMTVFVSLLCISSVGRAGQLDPQQLSDFWKKAGDDPSQFPADDATYEKEIQKSFEMRQALPKDETQAHALIKDTVRFYRQYQNLLKTGTVTDAPFLVQYSQINNGKLAVERGQAAIIAYAADHNADNAIEAIKLCPAIAKIFAAVSDDQFPQIVAHLLAIANAQALEFALDTPHSSPPTYLNAVGNAYIPLVIGLCKSQGSTRLLAILLKQYPSLRSLCPSTPNPEFVAREIQAVSANAVQAFLQVLLADPKESRVLGKVAGVSPELKAIILQQVSNRIQTLKDQSDLLGKIRESLQMSATSTQN